MRAGSYAARCAAALLAWLLTDLSYGTSQEQVLHASQPASWQASWQAGTYTHIHIPAFQVSFCGYDDWPMFDLESDWAEGHGADDDDGYADPEGTGAVGEGRPVDMEGAALGGEAGRIEAGDGGAEEGSQHTPAAVGNPGELLVFRPRKPPPSQVGHYRCRLVHAPREAGCTAGGSGDPHAGLQPWVGQAKSVQDSLRGGFTAWDSY